MSDGYWGSDLWDDHVASASQTYRSEITRSDSGNVVVVEAHADTMTRYTIIATRLPDDVKVGGKAIVTVLHPWGTAYPCDSPDLDPGYVVSKWGPRENGVNRYDRVHGGDAACVTQAIFQAMTVMFSAD